MGSFVRFENVNKEYRVGDMKLSALRDVSFDIDKGEICIILGQSGAGKTTILNILGGMDTLTSGKVYLGEKEISSFNKNELTTYRREDIGFVFQFYNLIPNLTAIENVEIVTQMTVKILFYPDNFLLGFTGKRVFNITPYQLSAISYYIID